MAQSDVYQFLKNNQDKWFTSKEIAEKLKISCGSITRSLKVLRTTSNIFFKKHPERHLTYIYMVQEEDK